MRYLNWFLRALLFIALFGLAVMNNQSVTLRYFFGYEWQTSMVVLLLLFFAAGTGAGLLAMFGTLMQQRREIARLERDMKTTGPRSGDLGEEQRGSV